MSSLVDGDGKDWIGFHPEKGSGASGEYRGFPNAVHKQAGTYLVELGAAATSTTEVTDTGSTGADALTVTATAGPDSLLVTTNQVTLQGTFTGTVNLQGVEDLTVDGSDGNDTITVDGSQTTILGGAGNDTIVVLANGPHGLLLDGQEGADDYAIQFGSLVGPVTVDDTGTDSTDSLTINGTAGEDILVQTGMQISRGDETVVFGASVDSVTVAAGEGDQFVVTEPSSVPLLLDGAAEFVVYGTAGDDHILFNPGTVAGEVVAKLNGSEIGTLTDVAQLVAYGLAGNDTIQVAGSITVSAWFDGGLGNDRLKGGAGHDVLLGREGNDLLVGKNGLDLLIGGLGADRLVGNAGDDILVAGRVTLAESQLDRVISEWTSGIGTYEQRQDNVRVYLRTDGADPTVFADDSKDVLTGSAGIDWFFANLGETGVTDKITDLSDEEFLPDLEFILTD